MHSGTEPRRNSGRREPVDSATEKQTADGQFCHRRWCNGELRASPVILKNISQVNPVRMQDKLEGYKGCSPTSEISQKVMSNHNPRQMII